MARARCLFAVAIVALAWAAPAWAVQPDEMLPDPALEARARNLSRELRCMVCQNQSIDDSDAPLARDLRILVRDRLKSGDSDRQVIDFLTVRYGDFVLLKPRFSWRTAALWGTPAALLVFGGLGLVLFLRRRTAPAAAAPGLTPAEQQRVDDILRQEG
jgi:cytochrome c-type biogenesis protein CcmH